MVSWGKDERNNHTQQHKPCYPAEKYKNTLISDKLPQESWKFNTYFEVTLSQPSVPNPSAHVRLLVKSMNIWSSLISLTRSCFLFHSGLLPRATAEASTARSDQATVSRKIASVYGSTSRSATHR